MPNDAAGNEITGDVDLDAAAAAQFAHAIDPEHNADPDENEEDAPTLDPNASPTGGEGAGSDPSGSVGSDPNLSTDEWVWDDGYKLTKEQARSYAELEAFLYANPDKAQALGNFLRGESPGDITNDPTKGSDPVTGAGETPTPEIDLSTIDDPEIKAVVLQNQRMIKELEELKASQTGLSEFVSTQQEQQANALMSRATTSFKEQKKLSDDEMTRLTEVTARLNILPGLMGPVDPITNLPRKVDPLAAIEEALETAYWQIPEFRDRAISSELEAQTKNKVRKGKLSSLQGASGSVSREAPVPKTEHERRDAMIAEVASAMGRE
jgi:hypothetical protein